MVEAIAVTASTCDCLCTDNNDGWCSRSNVHIGPWEGAHDAAASTKELMISHYFLFLVAITTAFLLFFFESQVDNNNLYENIGGV